MNPIAHIDTHFSRISDNIIIKSIRQGLLYIMPMIMVGSFVLMVLNLPIEWINNLLGAILGDHWRTVGLAIHKGTFRIMSLSTLIAVSYALSRELKEIRNSDVNTIIILLTSLSCYVAFNPTTESVVDENATGATGMFGAIAIAIASNYVFFFFHTKLPRRMKVFAYDADAILLSSLFNVLPVFFTIATFALVRHLGDLSGISTALVGANENMIHMLLNSGNGLLTAIVYTLVTQIMWFLGIHGTNVMERISQDLFVTASDINLQLAQSGQLPTQVITKEFLDNFVFLGGCGSTLGLLIALFLAGRSSNVSGLAKYSLFPGLFNINEVMVYGLPIIFNPYYLIPFALTPTLLCITSYIAFSSGLVALTTERVVWTTPIFLSGYISTGSVSGILLQLVNLLVAAMVYLPFVRMYEKQISRNNMRVFQEMSRVYNSAQPDQPIQMLSRSDELGAVARALATELRANLSGNAKGLCMEYQPKTDAHGNVFGAEALLRWYHPVYNRISPMVTLGIADEAELTVELGSWILEQSFAQLGEWKRQNCTWMLSVNLSPKQLKADAQLPERIRDMVKKYDLDTSAMELELTEHAALDQSIATRNRLEQIKDLGVNISIDDFGMGNSSLLYLRDFYANIVKIDMSLVQSVNENIQSQEIIRSIVLLCNQLEVGVIAEGVETAAQLHALQKMGCRFYQGWYFSQSLPPEDFMEYASRKSKSNVIRIEA